MLSVLSKKAREGGLSVDDAQRIVDIFQQHVAAGSYEVLLIGAGDYRAANRLIGRFDTGLRALDALHVAVASREQITLATADSKLAEAAKRLGGKVDFIDYPAPGGRQ